MSLRTWRVLLRRPDLLSRRPDLHSPRPQTFPLLVHASWDTGSLAGRRNASSTAAAAASVVVGEVPTSTSALTSFAWTDMLRQPMEYMHDSLHLPYVWIIPIAALAVRALLYRPITLATRQALQRRLAISPLISAHKPWYRSEAKMLARRDPSRSMLVHNRALLQNLTAELQTRHRCGYLKTFFLPMLQFPVFVGMSWILRDMLGMSGGGIKSFLYTMLGWDQATATEVAQGAVPAMLHEGVPWASDLTAADPTGMLSYGVAGIMLSQTLLGMRSVPGGSTMLSRTLVVFSLLIGPLMASAPAGILYYWACSSGLALVTNVYLDWRYPLVRFAPCKRRLLNNGLPIRARHTKQAAQIAPEPSRTDSPAIVSPP